MTDDLAQLTGCPMSAIDYVDLVIQVPQLMSCFTQRSRKALLSTNMLFRTQIHKHITSIRCGTSDVPSVMRQHRLTLKSLNLSSSDLEEDTLQELAKEPWPLLQTLDLSRNGEYPDVDWSAMRDINCPTLQTVDLSQSSLDDESCTILATCDWPQLRSLDISANYIGVPGLKHLVTANWPLLEELALSGPMDAQCIRPLCNGRWPRLTLHACSVRMRPLAEAEPALKFACILCLSAS